MCLSAPSIRAVRTICATTQTAPTATGTIAASVNGAQRSAARTPPVPTASAPAAPSARASQAPWRTATVRRPPVASPSTSLRSLTTDPTRAIQALMTVAKTSPAVSSPPPAVAAPPANEVQPRPNTTTAHALLQRFAGKGGAE